jgi:uncharacterized protein (TIGR00290 family)
MKSFLNWSGGKDSALCLHKARGEGISIEALVTALHGDRISMHGVQRSLLQQQAAALQLPLHTIELPEHPGMKEYEAAIHQSNRLLYEQEFRFSVSGDLFLEELRHYRKTLYAVDEIKSIFPLWKMNTAQLLKDFIELGFKAIIVAVNGNMLHPSFCGRMIDESFINDLPPGVDTCGENGEYHSFVFDGPHFRHPVPFTKGEIISHHYPDPVAKDQQIPFYFCDLLPHGESPTFAEKGDED